MALSVGIRAVGGRALALGCALLGLGLGGCGNERAFRVSELHNAGRFEEASALAGELPFEGLEGDTVWALIEAGKAHQDAGRWEASAERFDAALSVLRSVERRAVVSVSGVGNEIKAFLSDERSRDYLSGWYEVRLVLVAQGVNYLMMGRPREAATYLNLFVDETDGLYAKLKIAEEDAGVFGGYGGYAEERRGMVAGIEGGVEAERGDGWGVEGAIASEPRLAARAAELRSGVDGGEALVGYGYLVGWLTMREVGDAGMAEEFARRLRDAVGSTPGVEALLGGGLDGRVFVLFENGLGPARVDGSLRVSGLNLLPIPTLARREGGRARGLRVVGDGAAEAVLLTRVDRLVEADFADNLDLIWARPLASLAIKAGVTIAAQEAVRREGETAQAVVQLLGLAWQGLAQPDLRSWRTVAGELWAGVVDAPSDGVLRLELLGGGGVAGVVELAVPEGGGIVFVRSTGVGNMRAYSAPFAR